MPVHGCSTPGEVSWEWRSIGESTHQPQFFWCNSGCPWLSGWQALIAGSCPIFNPAVSPSTSVQGLLCRGYHRQLWITVPVKTCMIFFPNSQEIIFWIYFENKSILVFLILSHKIKHSGCIVRVFPQNLSSHSISCTCVCYINRLRKCCTEIFSSIFVDVKSCVTKDIWINAVILEKGYFLCPISNWTSLTFSCTARHLHLPLATPSMRKGLFSSCKSVLDCQKSDIMHKKVSCWAKWIISFTLSKIFHKRFSCMFIWTTHTFKSLIYMLV